eukprot:CAMPEP_0174259810 /NCGR_PEP_ID=MMETSP0439-20130205/8592_1 /TAXON_ID=0 /ORGANISM="Stereomyxa ramosa, Strain Chinc5" /LENGTH=180 /DNA_ID=CAMNT_0015343861 /DNA_START=64 /DNA_END=607 /DNA_ORIENTATION=+
MSTKAVKLHPGWMKRHQGFLSAIRGFRNGITTGARIRLPYAFQALIYAVVFRERSLMNRTKFVIRQMFQHGKNLGLFVFVYKSICYIFRSAGISGGIESWVAGFVGGFTAFGESKGLSGSVNMQIVLYLFARGIFGSMAGFASKGYLPQQLNPKTPLGFRIFAGFSLALILYLTDTILRH